jgi:transposase
MGTISMSRKERKRLEAFSRVKLGGMTLVEASELLRLSYRQTKRAWSRYQSEGEPAGARLRPGRRLSPEGEAQSLALYRQRYASAGRQQRD